MGKKLNKEQAVFFAGAVLFLWVMAKLVLFLTQSEPVLGKPRVPPAAIASGDPELLKELTVPALASYLGRGRDPFASGAQEPAGFFVQTTIFHTITRDAIQSRYMFDCRMLPSSVKEIRFLVPEGVRVENEKVGGEERDWDRTVGQAGRMLSVPVKANAVARTYYRSRVTILIESKPTLPAAWVAPIVCCTGAMKTISSEAGDLALITPNDTVKLLLPTASASPNLQPLGPTATPKALQSNATKYAYHFTLPDYQLSARIEDARPVRTYTVRPREPVVRPPTPRTTPPRVRTDPPTVETEPPPPEKPKIPPPPGGDDLPFKVAAIVVIEEPEPRRQVVLRNKDSGEYIRKFEGDSFDGMKIQLITDNSVTILDDKGRVRTLQGRFLEQYNP